MALRDVGDFIREQRRNAQISLRQLAKQTGVSNPYLSQIERGLRKPSAEVLQQIANALRVSTPVMYLRAGLLEHSDGQGVLTAIAADEVLTARQKQSLAEIYEAFRRENLRYAKADVDQPGDGAADDAADAAPTDVAPADAASTDVAPADAASTDVAPADAAPTDVVPSGAERSDGVAPGGGTTGDGPATTPEPHDQGVGAAAGAGGKPAPAAETTPDDTRPAGDPFGPERPTAVPRARTAASAARRAASKAAQRAADGAARAAGSSAARAAQRSAGKAAQRAADTAAGKAVRSAVGRRGRGRPDDQ